MSKKQNQIWHGENIHAYTKQVNLTIPQYLPQIYGKYGEKLSLENLNLLLAEFQKKYGPKVTYSNIRNVFANGEIFDKDAPQLNSAILLQAIWDILCEKNEESLFRHFGETLDQIGSTCIVGVSHRLFMDYVAFVESLI